MSSMGWLKIIKLKSLESSMRYFVINFSLQPDVFVILKLCYFAEFFRFILFGLNAHAFGFCFCNICSG